MFTDPTGEVIYKLDSMGRLIEQIEDDEEYDMFIIENGAIYIADKGAIQFMDSRKSSTGQEYDVISVSKDEDARKFFEFLANATGSEYSLLQTGDSSDANYITTSHKDNSEAGQYDYAVSLFNRNVDLKKLSHNHPGLSPYPSAAIGSNSEGKSGDVTVAKKINQMYGKQLDYYIYMKDTGVYIPYNENSHIDYYRNNLNSKRPTKTILRIIVDYLSR